MSGLESFYGTASSEIYPIVSKKGILGVGMHENTKKVTQRHFPHKVLDTYCLFFNESKPEVRAIVKISRCVGKRHIVHLFTRVHNLISVFYGGVSLNVILKKGVKLYTYFNKDIRQRLVNSSNLKELY